EQRQTKEAVMPRLGDPAELVALLDGIRPPAAGGGRRLIAAILDPATSVGGLENVRRHAGELIKRAENMTQKAAAELLYHAAVAAAYGRHGANIASRPIEARRVLYDRLATLLGPGPLGDVFRGMISK